MDREGEIEGERERERERERYGVMVYMSLMIPQKRWCYS